MLFSAGKSPTEDRKAISTQRHNQNNNVKKSGEKANSGDKKSSEAAKNLSKRIDTLAARVEELEADITNQNASHSMITETPVNEAHWYERGIMGSASLLATFLLGIIFWWSYSNLINKNKRRKEAIFDLQKEINALRLERNSTHIPSIARDDSTLRNRIEELERAIADFQSTVVSNNSTTLNYESAPEAVTSNPTSADLIYLYVDINNGASQFLAGPKTRHTVLRLKNIGGDQFNFGIDPELKDSEIDDILTKPKLLEPFADLIVANNPRRIAMRDSGLARRLPNGTFEVVKKAQIEFLS